MIPTRIDLVDRLPTTPNGKIDYKRLVAERSS
jgi:non-ribosomal peptide synthetase component E (peptide arylation enzyme)